jgi:hypothetical protein
MDLSSASIRHTNQSRSLTKARDGRRTEPGHKGGIPLDLDGLTRPMILLDEQGGEQGEWNTNESDSEGGDEETDQRQSRQKNV